MSYNDPLEAPTGVLGLENLSGFVPTLCCALSQDDTLLATGGMDRKLSLCQWRDYMDGKDVVKEAIRVDFVKDTLSASDDATVLSVDFARKAGQPFVACGCNDGSVRVVQYDTSDGLKAHEIAKDTILHEKHVRHVAWASHDNLLASASADGTVLVHKIALVGTDAQIEKVETLNLSGPVEALCFHKEKLVCYARGTPELLYFDIQENFKESKINLNQGDESFAVMDIAAHGDYLALATDTSRNIIIEFETGKHIRDLEGHQNEDISEPGDFTKNRLSWFYCPKVAWSLDGKHLYGNTIDGPAIFMWDVATGDPVNKLEDYHEFKIYDIVSSQRADMIVTISVDKKCNLWFSPVKL